MRSTSINKLNKYDSYARLHQLTEEVHPNYWGLGPCLVSLVSYLGNALGEVG